MQGFKLFSYGLNYFDRLGSWRGTPLLPPSAIEVMKPPPPPTGQARLVTRRTSHAATSYRLAYGRTEGRVARGRAASLDWEMPLQTKPGSSMLCKSWAGMPARQLTAPGTLLLFCAVWQAPASIFVGGASG